MVSSGDVAFTPWVTLGAQCGTQRMETSLTHPRSGHSGAPEPPQCPHCVPHHLLSHFPYGNRKSLVCLFPSTLSDQVICVGGVESGFSLTEELGSRWDTVFIFFLTCLGRCFPFIASLKWVEMERWFSFGEGFLSSLAKTPENEQFAPGFSRALGRCPSFCTESQESFRVQPRGEALCSRISPFDGKHCASIAASKGLARRVWCVCSQWNFPGFARSAAW